MNKNDIQRLPTPERLLHMRETIIRFRLDGIRTAMQAIGLESKYNGLSFIDVLVENEGERIFHGILFQFTQPSISMAIVHCRCLLEFMGLKTSGHPSKLITVSRRRNGDIGIEHFESSSGCNLAKMKPDIVSTFETVADVAETWTTVIEIANQRLAHSTDDLKLGGTDTQPVIMTALETVSELVQREFYNVLNKD
jgi:hypothetical protein